MTAYEKYEQPKVKVVVMPNKQVLGKTFKRQAKAVQEVLEQMQVPAAHIPALPLSCIDALHAVMLSTTALNMGCSLVL